MKTAKILLALVIFTFSFHTAISAGLNSVFSKDGNYVWGVGTNGYIIYSTNGGSTWSNNSIGTVTYNSVSANGQYVWIAGNNGLLEMTTDNGYDWIQMTLAGGINLKSVFFLNASTGFIAGDNGTILKSTNSGLNWSAQTSTTSNNLNCITFADNNNGVCCGVNGTVITTSNGGISWILSTTPTTKELLSVDMKSGTIIASGIDQSVIKSTNNGVSWSSIDYGISTKSDINSVFMMDAGTYYSCGGGGFIRISTDGGVTFTFQINPMLADLYKIYFFDNNKGWAAGRDNNVVIRTTDGGNTWQLPANTTQQVGWTFRLTTDPEGTWGGIFSLSRQNPSEVFACANKHVYRTLNYGQNWVSVSTTIPYGTAPHCFNISPLDSNKMLVAYDSLFNNPPYMYCKIFRTSDYGVTWTQTFAQGIDVDSNPMALDPDHPDTVYLCTTDSLVFRSTDFGATWSPTGPAHLRSLCSIAVVKGHSNIIIAGTSNDVDDSAYVYRSTDYGASWNMVYQSVGSFPEIPCITYNPYYPDKLYFASFFGNPHGLYVSTNDGLNWTQSYPDENVWGIGIAADDPNVMIWGYGGGFTAFYTLNGGLNWNQTTIPGTNNQSIICFNRKTIFSQQNHAIYQLSIAYNNPIGIQPVSTAVPKQFSLDQNYPNPFNPATKIRFNVARPLNLPLTGGDVTAIAGTVGVKLIIYDMLGRMVATLVNEHLGPGTYEVSWDASNYPSGVYFYRLQVNPSARSEISDGFTESKKMVLVK